MICLENIIKMETNSHEFLHYATMLFREFTHLMKKNIRKKSLHRRASNNYAVNIFEVSFKSLEELLKLKGIKPKGNIRDKINQAEQEGFYSTSLVKVLYNSRLYRNQIVHEGIKVTELLLTYSNLLLFITLSYCIL